MYIYFFTKHTEKRKKKVYKSLVQYSNLNNYLKNNHIENTAI